MAKTVAPLVGVYNGSGALMGIAADVRSTGAVVDPATLGRMTAADQVKLAALPDAATLESRQSSQDSAIAAKYTKPGSGIPSSDLASAVQTALTAATNAAPQSTTYTKTQTDSGIAAAVSAHTAATNPHTQYLTTSEASASYLTQTTGDSRYIRGFIPYATIGDSISNVSGTTSVHNWRYPPSGSALNPDKDASQIAIQSGGWLRLVANCGISGDNSAQLLARDALAASATRRAISDAGNLGARVGFVSIGINDIQQNVFSTTSTATRDAWLAAALYPNIEKALRRIKAIGVEPYFMSLAGYDYGTFAVANPSIFPNGAADVAPRRVCAGIVNAYIRDVMIPALGFGGYIDVNAGVVNGDGSWVAGMSTDGLHPSKLGAQARAALIVSAMFGAVQDPLKVRRLYNPGGTSSVNAFANPTMSVAASNGASGVSYVGVVGSGATATFTNSVVTAYGCEWHSSRCVPTAVDSSFSTTGVQIDFLLPIFGATPAVSFASGDLLGVEAVVIIDSGTEGVAPADLIAFAGRSRVWYASGASSYYADCIAYDLTVANQVTLTGVQKLKFTIPALVMPDASAGLTDAKFTVFAFSRNLQPFRVLVSGVTAVKLPAGF